MMIPDKDTKQLAKENKPKLGIPDNVRILNK